jgi:heme exporter protein CcmD
MFELGRHAGFIIASYATTFVIMAFVALLTLRQYRAAKARLREMQGGAD